MERVACQFAGTEACHVFRKNGACFEDVHHLFYPKSEYQEPIEKRFRELDENKVRMCRDLHNTEHHVFEIPGKPDLEIMRLAVSEVRNRRIQEER